MQTSIRVLLVVLVGVNVCRGVDTKVVAVCRGVDGATEKVGVELLVHFHRCGIEEILNHTVALTVYDMQWGEGRGVVGERLCVDLLYLLQSLRHCSPSTRSRAWIQSAAVAVLCFKMKAGASSDSAAAVCVLTCALLRLVPLVLK